MFAWQTDDWSSLRKNKFHPSMVVFGCDFSLDGYLSALQYLIVISGHGVQLIPVLA